MDSKVLLMLVMVELYIQQHTIPLNHIPFLKHTTVALHFFTLYSSALYEDEDR